MDSRSPRGEDGIRRGMVSYLQKPISIEMLAIQFSETDLLLGNSFPFVPRRRFRRRGGAYTKPDRCRQVERIRFRTGCFFLRVSVVVAARADRKNIIIAMM